ncbi:MAG: cysteine hydrolase [Clostridia bacterium]|nr:cysteine hydrolase [Clostridia bacterium]NLS85669.1 cysteine hydrolase [Oscillospiraceae bacterium]
MKILIVVDMQNDFIDGSLGTKEAVAILPKVLEKIEHFDGEVFATRDTHGENYLSTAEGKHLPVEHCIKGTDGWQLNSQIAELIKTQPIDKPTFGSTSLAHILASQNAKQPIESITLVGLCTDICVISNALLLKAAMPETRIIVDESCCAGVTPESHTNAINAMKMCQIEIE